LRGGEEIGQIRRGRGVSGLLLRDGDGKGGGKGKRREGTERGRREKEGQGEACPANEKLSPRPSQHLFLVFFSRVLCGE